MHTLTQTRFSLKVWNLSACASLNTQHHTLRLVSFKSTAALNPFWPFILIIKTILIKKLCSFVRVEMGFLLSSYHQSFVSFLISSCGLNVFIGLILLILRRVIGPCLSHVSSEGYFCWLTSLIPLPVNISFPKLDLFFINLV